MEQGVAQGLMEQTLYDAASEKGQEQVDHLFSQGMYARGLWIPAGTTVVGRLHAQPRICVIAAGHCHWIDEYHDEAQEVRAPWMGSFEAGSKTAVFAIEDTYWIAFLATELKSADNIVEQLTTTTHQEYEARQKRLEQKA